MQNLAFQRSDSPTVSSATRGAGSGVADLQVFAANAPTGRGENERPSSALIERLADGSWKIGALVRIDELAAHEGVARAYPLLVAAIRAGDAPDVSNVATLAAELLQRTRCAYFRDASSACNKRTPGSGCAAIAGFHRAHAIFGGSRACIATHPSDLCVALAALEAEVTVAGPEGERTILFSDFHLLPGLTPEREHALREEEWINTITLPPPLAGAGGHFLKLRERESSEGALISVAALVQREGGCIREARIALGGVGPKPWRVPAGERMLQGHEPASALFKAAAENAFFDAEPRQHNGFKVPLARLAIQRALVEATTDLAGA